MTERLLFTATHHGLECRRRRSMRGSRRTWLSWRGRRWAIRRRSAVAGITVGLTPVGPAVGGVICIGGVLVSGAPDIRDARDEVAEDVLFPALIYVVPSEEVVWAQAFAHFVPPSSFFVPPCLLDDPREPSGWMCGPPGDLEIPRMAPETLRRLYSCSHVY